MRDRTMNASDAMILASFYGDQTIEELKEPHPCPDWAANSATLAAHYALLYVEICEDWIFPKL